LVATQIVENHSRLDRWLSKCLAGIGITAH
jgi:hypothetical protein